MGPGKSSMFSGGGEKEEGGRRLLKHFSGTVAQLLPSCDIQFRRVMQVFFNHTQKAACW